MFSWFKKPTEEEKARQARQEADIKALESGGIPLTATMRLQEQMNSPNHLFSSDLSTKEFLIARQAGYSPIAQVMGSAFMNISFFGNMRRNSTGELNDISDALSRARHLAIDRMKQEAKLLGATGVIGIKLTRRGAGWDARMVEFTAVGTAIRVPDMDAVAKKGQEPFTSLLSAQEFWQLHMAGIWPVSVCMGVCSYYVWSDAETRKQLYSWWGGNNTANAEIRAYTQGFYEARERALSRMSLDIEAQGGDGSIGMIIDQDVHTIEYEINERTYKDFLANFSMMGTTVVRVADPAKIQPRRTLMMLDLAKGKNVNISFDEPEYDDDGED